MKKIIATVLAMVMALALCTTAFAATTTTLTAKDYKFLDSTTNGDRETWKDGDTLVFYAEEKSVSTVDGKTTTTITPAYYLYNTNKYVVVDDWNVLFRRLLRHPRHLDHLTSRSVGSTNIDAQVEARSR